MPAASFVDPPALGKPAGHYSHAVIANGFIFVSGQLPVTPEGVPLVDASFEQQAAQALANVRAVLRAAGADVDRLVNVRVYVSDIAHWPVFNEVYARWAGACRPARAVVPTGPLHHGLQVEIEAVALAA